MKAKFYPHGMDEGEICNRIIPNGAICEGVMEYTQEPCYCSITPMPPCGNCTSSKLECPNCGWEYE